MAVQMLLKSVEIIKTSKIVMFKKIQKSMFKILTNIFFFRNNS